MCILFLNLLQACKVNPSKAVKVGVPSEEVTLRVLMMKGPYMTAHHIYTSFSSHCHSNVSLVQKSMQELQDAGLGEFKVLNKLKIFIRLYQVMIFSLNWQSTMYQWRNIRQLSSRKMTG